MIYRLRRKFILVCTVSVLAVITLVFCVILALNVSSMNRNMDMLADKISEGDGRFPGSAAEKPPYDKAPPKNGDGYGFITPETPFSTRYFAVFFDNGGEVARTNTESIYSVTEAEAVEYAERVVSGGDGRGWLESYRYKVFSTDMGKGAVFVDGSMSRSALTQSMTIAGFVLLCCAALVLLLIVLLSKRVVKPIAESYEKQRQFVTDANHELKTPLTLILANLDIAEAELGRNEWLEDIRSEGTRMAELVNQLVALSRMDEDAPPAELSRVALGGIVEETVSEFEPLATERGRSVTASVDGDATLLGDEALLRRLVGILMDNAVKYCDVGGQIAVTLRRGRRITLTVTNTYEAVGELELDRLFDRFYRADKARRFSGGYGIGLSMARSIAEKHGGEISAHREGDSAIAFRVIL